MNDRNIILYRKSIELKVSEKFDYVIYPNEL